MQCGRVGSRLLSAGAPRIQYPQGSFFCACPIFLWLCTLKPSECSSLWEGRSMLVHFPSLLPVSFLPVPCRKPYFCQLLIGSCHPFFHPFTRERHSFPSCLSCHPHSIPLAFWCWKPRYLTRIARLLDADCNVIWRRLRHDLRQVRSWYGTGWNVICRKSRGEAYVLYLWCGDFVVLFVID